MTANPEQPQLNRIIRERELYSFTGLRRTQLAALIRAGEFPKPVRLTAAGRSKGWLANEVAAWQTKQIAKRGAAE